MEEVHLNLVLATVLPVGLSDCEVRLRAALRQVGRDVDLDTHLLGELRSAIWVVGLRVTARDQNTTVIEELDARLLGLVRCYAQNVTYGGLRVVQTSDDRVVEDGEPLTHRLRRVVEEGAEIREVSETETCHTLRGTVDNEIRPIRQGCGKR